MAASTVRCIAPRAFVEAEGTPPSLEIGKGGGELPRVGVRGAPLELSSQRYFVRSRDGMGFLELKKVCWLLGCTSGGGGVQPSS